MKNLFLYIILFVSLLQLSCGKNNPGENIPGNDNRNKNEKYIKILFDKLNENECSLLYVNKNNRKLYLDNGLSEIFDGIYFKVYNNIN